MIIIIYIIKVVVWEISKIHIFSIIIIFLYFRALINMQSQVPPYPMDKSPTITQQLTVYQDLTHLWRAQAGRARTRKTKMHLETRILKRFMEITLEWMTAKQIIQWNMCTHKSDWTSDILDDKNLWIWSNINPYLML